MFFGLRAREPEATEGSKVFGDTYGGVELKVAETPELLGQRRTGRLRA